MKVLIFGAAGQLGSELYQRLKSRHEVLGLARREADITQLKQVLEIAHRFLPEVIINAAAYTDVDGCERDPERAFLVNALGARNVAIAAREVEAKLVHISTDYVFDGKKESPYREHDPPNPINIYGLSKLTGEEFVRGQTPKHFILRVAWLYGRTGKNFLKTMLSLSQTEDELRVVNDQWGTPTCVEDLVRQIGLLIETDFYGTYHCTSQGECTRFDFALEIFKNVGYEAEILPNGAFRLIPQNEGLRPITIRPVPSTEFPTPAKRPRYSVLENYFLKLQSLDIMPDWREALRAFLDRLKGEGGIHEGLGIGRR